MEEVSVLARLVARAFNGSDIDTDAFSRLETASEGTTLFANDERSQLNLMYSPEFGVLSVVDVAVATDMVTERDIGEAAAADVYRTVVDSLMESGAIEATGLEANHPQTSFTLQGEGWAGETPRERVKEYIFFARRVLDGAGIRYGLWEAGVQVSVHRRGDVASIKILGPLVVGSSGDVEPKLDQAEADRSAAASYPGHVIEPHGLSYVLDDDSSEFRLRWSYRVYSQTDVGGRTINGRAQYVFYSIDGSGEKGVWPVAEPNAVGDRRE